MIENLQKDLTVNFYLSVEIKDIEIYLLGAMNSFIKQNSHNWFKANDLVPTIWTETPLQKIYDFFYSNGLSDNDSKTESAKILGQILKKIILDDSRTFETKKNNQKVSPREYKLK